MTALKILILDDRSFVTLKLHQRFNALGQFDVRVANSLEAASERLALPARVDLLVAGRPCSGPEGEDWLGHQLAAGRLGAWAAYDHNGHNPDAAPLAHLVPPVQTIHLHGLIDALRTDCRNGQLS